MKTTTGTGNLTTTQLLVHTGPAGFYTLGVALDVSGVPAGSPTPLVLLQVTGPRPGSNVTCAATAALPKPVGVAANVYLEPGDVFNVAVTQVNFGAQPDASWTLNTFLYAPPDIAA